MQLWLMSSSIIKSYPAQATPPPPQKKKEKSPLKKIPYIPGNETF